MGLSLMNMLGLSSNVRIALIECYWEFFLLRSIQLYTTYCPGVCLSGLRKIMEVLSEDSRCPARNSNPILSEHKSNVS
jgi:hypothetical protein